MSATPLGFVSPDDDDPVDVPDDMHDQAISIDAYLTPQFATITPGPAPYAGTLYLTRVGALVILQGGVRNGGAAPPGGWVAIGAVPTGMLPVAEVVMPGAVEPGTNIDYRLRIDPSGTIQFRHFHPTGGGTSNTMPVSAVWATAVGA